MDKEKFQLEFQVRASSNLLYTYISNTSELSDWYADDVNFKDDVFTFTWDGSDEEAILLKKKAGEYIRFQWLEDEDTDYFFEMRIVKDEITKDVSLVVTDFSEPDEIEDAKMLWENQIEDLKSVIGH